LERDNGELEVYRVVWCSGLDRIGLKDAVLTPDIRYFEARRDNIVEALTMERTLLDRKSC
jgi:hypothetical protein